MKSALLFLLLLAPQDPAALSAKARQMAAEKRYDEAESLWRKALSEKPDYFPALFNLGYINYTRGRMVEAREWLDRAAGTDPRDFNTRYLLGTVLVRLDKRDDGLRQWRAALALEPENLKLMQVMVVEYEKGLYFHEAAALAKRALALQPDNINLYLRAINECQNARDYAGGLALAREAAAKFPHSARANFEYAFHLEQTGKSAESVRYLKKAMEADPHYEEPFFFYGDLLVNQGEDEAAIPYLRKAIADRPDYVEARVSIAKALMHLEKWQDAIGELQEASRRNPRHPEPHLLLSRIYFRLGDEAKARAEKEISLRLRRESPALLEAVQPREFH
jgi:tetratricopeptide (TPR) repeat protein